MELGRDVGSLVANINEDKNITGFTVLDSTAVNTESQNSAKGSLIGYKARSPDLYIQDRVYLGDKIKAIIKSKGGYKANIEKYGRT